MTFLSLLVVEAERAVQLQVVLRIAESAVRIAVPQHTIVLVRHHKRHSHLRVILKQILVLSLHVQLLRLMLPQSVERLVGRAVEEQSPTQPLLLLLGGLSTANLTFRHLKLLERLSVHRLSQQHLSNCVVEHDSSVTLRHHGTHLPRPHRHIFLALLHFTPGQLTSSLHSPLPHLLQHDEALFLLRKRILAGGTNTDDAVIHHLQTYHTRLTPVRADGHGIARLTHHCGIPGDAPHKTYDTQKYLFHLPSILRCKVTSRKSDHQKNPKKNENLVLLQTLSPNLALFQRMQLVCGQDLRSFVSKTYVRLWNTLASASEEHLCLEFRV